MNAAQQALAKAPIYTDGRSYILVHLPAPAITAAAGVLAEWGEPFSALIVDKDEVTLALPEEGWREFSHRLPDHRTAGPYRLLTFDMTLSLDMVGFLALVSRLLAEAGVTVMAFSAFERDHLLIPVGQFEAAVAALRTAQSQIAGP
jgi:hypothetical protein